MNKTAGRNGLMLSLLAAVACSVCLTGCQTTIGGQTLPSPNYLRDDLQYHPKGPEFPHQNKVNAAKRYRAEQEAITQ